MRRLIRAACAGLALLVAGCGQSDVDRAPDIRFGRDACAECRMIIDDGRYAAAAATDDEPLKFDDIGCLARATAKRGASIRRWWVRDLSAGTWVPAHAASFVKLTTTQTPMGYGWAAFAERAKARECAAREGTAVEEWDTLIKEVDHEQS